jgi:hypothetical protein
MGIVRKGGYALLLALFFFAYAPQSHATAVLTLSDGTTTQTVNDTDGDGVASFSGMIGNFVVNVTTGLSKPTLTPSISGQLMDLDSLDVVSSGGGTLTITWEDFGFTNQVTGLQMGIGGTVSGNGTVDYKAYANNTNGDPLAGTLLGDLSFNGSQSPFSASVTTNFVGGPPTYSLAEVVTLNFTGSGSDSLDAEIKPIPEPGSLMLLGSGLLGFASFARKKFLKS